MSGEEELHLLHEFINQCPFGLVKTNGKGTIELINAKATQLLMPFAMMRGFDLSNIDVFLESYALEFFKRIEAFDGKYGPIITNERLAFEMPGGKEPMIISLNALKINDNLYQYTFNDVTKVVKAEEELNLLIEATALQDGKLEMSSGILHDIGNAITAFGTEVVKLRRDDKWAESQQLQKLQMLLEQKEAELDQALGPNKGRSMINFNKAVLKSLEDRQEQIKATGEKLYNTTSHIQDILNIQRHYALGKSSGKRAKINFRSVVEDALAMTEKSLVKRGIEIQKDIPVQLPEIEGDNTKLIQVLINIFKNAGEAFDNLEEDRDLKLDIKVEVLEEQIHFSLRDNGPGFDKEVEAQLFQKGASFKERGTGLGLYNCRTIIESHNGTIDLRSDGPNQGAKVDIYIPIN